MGGGECDGDDHQTGGFGSSMEGKCPERVVRSEAVLRARTGRILVVLDRVCDPHNIAAAVRTVEALGVQNVWIVAGTLGEKKRRGKRTRDVACIARGSDAWLSLRHFERPADCVAALVAEHWTVWIAADGERALSLASPSKPDGLDVAKLAVVIGREADGVCDDFARVADRRCLVPLHGFTTSLNLSVATGLILQRLFDWFPHFRGDLSTDEKAAVRSDWRNVVARTAAARDKCAPWLDHPELIPTEEGGPSLSSGSWAPNSIRQREQATNLGR